MLPRLHVVTDDNVLGRTDFMGLASQVMEVGGSELALHVRGPRSSGRTVFDAVAGLAPSAEGSEAWLFVNDRVDVALACGVPRVHLGRRSLRPSDARDVLGRDSVVGSSCHEVAEVSAAAAEGADFVFAGTIFRTPSHPDAEPAGRDAVSAAVGVVGSMPVVGIGGVGVGDVAGVLEAGAYGVAVVRAVWSNDDPAQEVERLLEALRPAPTGGA